MSRMPYTIDLAMEFSDAGRSIISVSLREVMDILVVKNYRNRPTHPTRSNTHNLTSSSPDFRMSRARVEIIILPRRSPRLCAGWALIRLDCRGETGDLSTLCEGFLQPPCLVPCQDPRTDFGPCLPVAWASSTTNVVLHYYYGHHPTLFMSDIPMTS
jgi:hypothetical protein